jgi:potassium-transporting ATPase KdpC subunit
MLFIALRLFAILSLLTGIVYPYSLTLLSHGLFPFESEGSILQVADKSVGSAWLAQKFERPDYFWPRPSAADYATVASGASNAGPTNANLKRQIMERRQWLSAAHNNPAVPEELLMTSGSGLDPHLSPQGVYYQVERVAKARGLKAEAVKQLIRQQMEPSQWGILGQERINVLRLNLALDQYKPGTRE